MFDREMQAALLADGEKLRQLTGEDHGPYYFIPHFVDSPIVAQQQGGDESWEAHGNPYRHGCDPATASPSS